MFISVRHILRLCLTEIISPLLHRNNYKIKVDHFNSLIQVNNSFNFWMNLDLTCVTGCLIFGNSKNGKYSVMEILSIEE